MQTRIENIPKELRKLNQWVCWTSDDKIPKSAKTGGNAMSNNPDTWSDFQTAVDACDKYGFEGIGFMFANGYFGVDLDHCLDNIDFVDEFVKTLQSYAEVSRSGSGIHIICKGKLPDGARHRGNVEMYSSGRYFICTGNLYNDEYKKVVDCTESIKILHSKYLPDTAPKIEQRQVEIIDLDDQEIIDKARNCRTGYSFNMLYSGNWQGIYTSQSEADLALCNQLAFWTQRNEQQMDRIFRSSGLMRVKWDSKRSGTTYGNITIGRACAACAEVYEPAKHGTGTDLALALFGDGKLKVEDNKTQYDMSDTGNAHRLHDKYGNMIRYSYNRKKWSYWSGKVWTIDDSGEIKKMADAVLQDIKSEAFNEADEDTQADKLKWYTRSSSSKSKESMIKECQHLEGIPASPDAFDSYTDYLNCKNGIVNLRNGELMPHDSHFMMSKICFAEYDTSNTKPKLWLKFLDDITAGNKELQAYIQKCVGYSLSGSNREQCAYFLYGIGNNGKSTFLDTISDILGDYASNVQPESIMLKRFGNDTANSDIARLKSARFVTCEEPTEGVRLNEGLLKQLTGGSKITCRFLYGDEFEYTPEFKIWVATNHKPIIRGSDVGIWRRIKLIPFEVSIPKDKVDKELKYKLRKESAQILKWAVDGCIKWQKEGIQEPVCVLDAIKEYKTEMDLLATFVEQCIEINYNPGNHIMANDLFRLYSKWAKANNEYVMTSQKFFREITKKLPDKTRSGKGIMYLNVNTTDYADDIIGSKFQYNFNDFKE